MGFQASFCYNLNELRNVLSKHDIFYQSVSNLSRWHVLSLHDSLGLIYPVSSDVGVLSPKLTV